MSTTTPQKGTTSDSPLMTPPIIKATIPSKEYTDETLKAEQLAMKSSPKTNESTFTGHHAFLPDEMVRSSFAKSQVKADMAPTTTEKKPAVDINATEFKAHRAEIDLTTTNTSLLGLDVPVSLVSIDPSDLRPDEMIPLDTELPADHPIYFNDYGEVMFTEDEMTRTVEMAKTILLKQYDDLPGFEVFVPGLDGGVQTAWEELPTEAIKNDELTEGQLKTLQIREDRKEPVDVTARRAKLEKRFKEQYGKAGIKFRYQGNEDNVPAAIKAADEISMLVKARKAQESELLEKRAKDGEDSTEFDWRSSAIVLPKRLQDRLDAMEAAKPAKAEVEVEVVGAIDTDTDTETEVTEAVEAFATSDLASASMATADVGYAEAVSVNADEKMAIPDFPDREGEPVAVDGKAGGEEVTAVAPVQPTPTKATPTKAKTEASPAASVPSPAPAHAPSKEGGACSVM